MVNEKESLKHKVLTILRESSGIVSGVELSNATGRSRVAVWKTVQGLQEAGYGIEVSRKGYRLVNDLADSIYPWEFGADEAMFTHFASTGSTMAEARLRESPAGRDPYNNRRRADPWSGPERQELDHHPGQSGLHHHH